MQEHIRRVTAMKIYVSKKILSHKKKKFFVSLKCSEQASQKGMKCYLGNVIIFYPKVGIIIFPSL